MSLPYYKFHPSDELGNYKIMNLPHDTLGVWYLFRICHLWQHQARLPDDPQYVAPLLKLTEERWLECRNLFLERGLIQVIDEHITIASFREQWEQAQTYTEGQRANRLETIRKKKERDILKKSKNNK